MRKVILSMLIVACLALPASAAVIHLKDGSRVRGTVVGATARDVRVHTDNGTLNIASERISRIEYDETETPTEEAPAGTQVRSKRAEREFVSFDDRRQMFSMNFGLATPLSRVDLSPAGGGSGDNGETGLNVGAQYAYYINRRLAVGMNLEYLGRSPSDSHSLLPSANSNVFGDTLLVLPILRYSLVTQGAARPYLLAGIGSNRTSTVIEATPEGGFAWSDTSTAETRALVDESRWGLATTARFGIDFLLSDPAVFSMEFGWTGIRNSDHAATAAGRDLGIETVSGDLNVLSIGARWGWRF